MSVEWPNINPVRRAMAEADYAYEQKLKNKKMGKRKKEHLSSVSRLLKDVEAAFK